MKKQYYPVVIISVAALTGVPVCGAAQAPSQPDILDEVVVTASRTAQSTATVSANVTIIGREQLAQSASRNVGDLLAEENIGHIQKYPASLTSIGIRGFQTDTHGNDLQGHVLILLDGRRAGTGNLAKILTKNVERIEIVRGPGAVQYGSAGMGGVVNIITRTGQRNSLFVEGGGGSFDSGEGSFGATLKQRGVDFAGSLTYQTRGDYDTGNGDRFDNTAIDSTTGISANLGYSFSATDRIGLIFTRFEVDGAGSPGYFSSVDGDDSTDEENYSLDARYTGASSSENWQWMIRYFFGNDENTWNDPLGSNPTGWDNGIPSTNDTDQQGAQAQVSGNFGPATITVGFDWLDYDVKNSWTPNKTSYTNPALFVLGRTSLLEDKLSVNFGVRYDWYTVKVEQPVGRDEDETHFTPTAGLAWMVRDDLKLRLQYGEAFMMPSAGQLAADYTYRGTRTVGNPGLDPEKSRTYEGGLDFFRSGLSASLTYFYTDFEDKIVSTELADGSRSWKNLGDATIAGLEAELGYDIGQGLGWSWEVRPYLNLTLLTTYKDDTTDTDLQYVSGTTYSTGLVTTNGDGIFCRLNVAYTGSQDVEDWESGISPTPDVTLDSFVVADLTASWRFYKDDALGAFTLRGEIGNLFDEEYAYVKGYPMPGRSLFAGLRWEY